MRQLKIATQITNRDSQAVEKYLQEISKISMITPEEETILAQRIKMNDQRSLDKLVQANLRFVVSVAKQNQRFQIHFLCSMVDSSVYLTSIGRTRSFSASSSK